jgi:hypothetical protein
VTASRSTLQLILDNSEVTGISNTSEENSGLALQPILDNSDRTSGRPSLQLLLDNSEEAVFSGLALQLILDNSEETLQLVLDNNAEVTSDLTGTSEVALQLILDSISGLTGTSDSTLQLILDNSTLEEALHLKNFDNSEIEGGRGLSLFLAPTG